MQIKRDVDFALRLLLATARHDVTTIFDGITVSELSRRTSVPPTIASRLCSKMAADRLLKTVKTSGSVKRYFIYESTLHKSLWDIIQTIEGENNLFSVFDKSTDMYLACQDCFDQIDQKLSHCLQEIRLRDLLNMLTRHATGAAVTLKKLN